MELTLAEESQQRRGVSATVDAYVNNNVTTRLWQGLCCDKVAMAANWTFEASDPGRAGLGQPPWEISEPDRKLLPAPFNFEKQIIALAFSKVAYYKFPYWSHFIFKF